MERKSGFVEFVGPYTSIFGSTLLRLKFGPVYVSIINNGFNNYLLGYHNVESEFIYLVYNDDLETLLKEFYRIALTFEVINYE